MVETFTAHITPFGLDRNTFVYLPDGWQTSGKRYPVVYMFDGHNLFFDSTATYGTCWGLKEYMDAHGEAIIVAPECNHEGNARLEEYSPYDFTWQENAIHGRGKAYLDWMVNELKPLIDAKYPTLSDRGNTAIGGSSMGGLMSLYGVTAHNATFSRAACLSPSVRFSFTEVKADIKKAKLAQYTSKALEVTNLLTAQGATVYPYCQLDGKHCEADWRRQLGRCFKFLFGWR